MGGAKISDKEIFAPFFACCRQAIMIIFNLVKKCYFLYEQ